MIGQIHKISFVYPPVSNRVAEWIKDDKEVQELLKDSNLYLIGQRPEIFFIFDKNTINNIHNTKKIQGAINSAKLNSDFTIDISLLIETYKIEFETIVIEVGEKIIIIMDQDNNILEWFTVEKLLFYRSRNYNVISGLDNYREFNNFRLHYVGISKKDDSLTRLVIKPHDKRLRILSKENSINGRSQLNDEICLFFCKIKNLEIKVLENNEYDKFVNNIGKTTGAKNNIIADVEKALIKIMNTDYNTIKYKNYPNSNDGLFNYDIDRIAYFFGESYSFKTKSNDIIGNFTNYDFDQQNIADFILVDKKEVNLIKTKE